MWSALFLTLPTQPKAIRLRIWRALKTLGCPSLRDGVYLLPESHAELFDPLVSEVRENGGQAHVLQLSTHDEAMRTEVLALFDRTKSYGEWHGEVQALTALLPELDETEARRRLRGVTEALQVLRRIDYYPGAAAQQAQAELDDLRQTIDTRFSKGEPKAQPSHGIARLDASLNRDHPFGTQLFDIGEGRAVAVGQNLRDPVMVAKVDEQHAAMVAHAMHPARQADRLSDVGCVKCGTSVAAVSVHRRPLCEAELNSSR